MHKTHKKQKILIVDDTKINLAILTDVLKDDYIVITANSGEQALDIIFSDTLPDIILLDVVMTGISGYDVCKKLKDTPLTKNIPIIGCFCFCIASIRTRSTPSHRRRKPKYFRNIRRSEDGAIK